MTKGQAMIMAVSLLVVGVFLIGAAYIGTRSQGEEPTANVYVEYPLSSLGVTRFIDEEAQVVCWTYSDTVPEGRGISCLPLDQTALEVEQ